ncbi:MAG: DUF3996 domain-containing protein [bacterium]|nr:DUF3996 domain-containing protein [bacterium]
MVRLMACFIIIAVLLSGAVAAQSTGFGLGVIVGEPTGLSCKLWRGSNTAIDGVAAWSFGKGGALQLHSDYLFHNFNLIKDNIPIYYGIGGKIKFAEKSEAGIRIPLGIDFLLTEAPLDIFFELVPLIGLVPATDFEVNGGIGIRYFF